MTQIRLQKYLSECGIASRRQAEMYILEGLVKVNGQIIDQMGIKIDPQKDQIRFRNKIVTPAKFVYYLLHKPSGYIATRKDVFAPKKVVDLVPPQPAVYPVGRLDKDTEGLIILTNDGQFTNQIIHPKNKIEKEYIVMCRQRFEDFKLEQAMKKLQKGVMISGYLTRPAIVANVSADRQKIRFHLTITEGKKHQVRRMCHNVGLKVINLTRIRIGNVQLGSLKRGAFRMMTDREVKSMIISISKTKPVLPRAKVLIKKSNI